MIFAIFQEFGPKTRKKSELLNFGRLPPSQFSLDFKKMSDLGYLNLYLQHILGASKSGKLDDPLRAGATLIFFLFSMCLQYLLVNWKLPYPQATLPVYCHSRMMSKRNMQEPKIKKKAGIYIIQTTMMGREGGIWYGCWGKNRKLEIQGIKGERIKNKLHQKKTKTQIP